MQPQFMEHGLPGDGPGTMTSAGLYVPRMSRRAGSRCRASTASRSSVEGSLQCRSSSTSTRVCSAVSASMTSANSRSMRSRVARPDDVATPPGRQPGRVQALCQPGRRLCSQQGHQLFAAGATPQTPQRLQHWPIRLLRAKLLDTLPACNPRWASLQPGGRSRCRSGLSCQCRAPL